MNIDRAANFFAFSLLSLILLLLISACTLPVPNSSSPSSKPSSRASSDSDKAAAVHDAIDVVLDRKPAGDAEKSAALQVLKENLSVKELYNNRSHRNDPALLDDIYPKETEIRVGPSRDQRVFWSAYDRSHFAARHLIEYFDSSDIKGRNGWWPAGTTQDQLDRYLEMTLKAYSNQIILPRPGRTGPGFKYYEFDLPDKSGIQVQVGIQSDGRVTSFFPLSGPNVISVSSLEVRRLLDAVHGETGEEEKEKRRKGEKGAE